MRYLYVFNEAFQEKYVSRELPDDMPVREVRELVKKSCQPGGTLYTCTEVPEEVDAGVGDVAEEYKEDTLPSGLDEFSQ